MSFSWSSFGATKPHSATHIDGGSDELDSPLNVGVTATPKPHSATHIDGGLDEINSALNPLIYAAINAQKIIDARNKIGVVTKSEAQDWIDSLGNLLANVTGVLQLYVISNDLLHSHDVEVTHSTTTYTKYKTITLNALYPSPSTLRIKFDLKSSGANDARGKIYKNGVAHGSEQTSSTSYVTKSQDLAFAQGDTIEIWLKNNSGTSITYVRNLRICGYDDIALADAIAGNDIGIADAFNVANS